MAIDRRPLDQMVQDVGPEAFQRLARLFEDETRGTVIALRQLLGEADWRELGRHAHSMKHATGSFGLIDLAAIAAAIERAADAHLPAEAEAQVTALEAAVDADLAVLDQVLRTIDA
jgi:HPt (histidine-containing phosphotransfer) domain-containing protein